MQSLGKSTHNQRIERLWRDLYGGCLSLFYELFYTLENQDVLNADDDCHLWCLHYVFVPIINRHLSNWKDAWVHHPLRTERNRTPMQLWISGLQEAWGFLGPEGEVFQVCNMFGFISSALLVSNVRSNNYDHQSLSSGQHCKKLGVNALAAHM